jgi:hypothetical protein
MNMMNANEVWIDRDRFDKCFEMMCEQYCWYYVSSESQEILDKHCEECPLNNIHSDEWWEEHERMEN